MSRILFDNASGHAAYYQDCSNAMLRMWMDNVVTDGEYNRIMDKLNEHEKKKGVLNEGQKNERYNQQTGGD